MPWRAVRPKTHSSWTTLRYFCAVLVCRVVDDQRAAEPVAVGDGADRDLSVHLGQGAGPGLQEVRLEVEQLLGVVRRTGRSGRVLRAAPGLGLVVGVEPGLGVGADPQLAVGALQQRLDLREPVERGRAGGRVDQGHAAVEEAAGVDLVLASGHGQDLDRLPPYLGLEDLGLAGLRVVAELLAAPERADHARARVVGQAEVGVPDRAGVLDPAGEGQAGPGQGLGGRVVLLQFARSGSGRTRRPRRSGRCPGRARSGSRRPRSGRRCPRRTAGRGRRC